ncbi:hypothetical protein ElyMa_001401400 [Elysia marginata]|uniref:ZP domain-containing protein n=1 Tax=Elysia marginata TaxID=1093978 RepID=A0AAV4IU11_9GAST|nr:hypothetical protein ElyMa_001401400 [Elysia marginata]
MCAAIMHYVQGYELVYCADEYNFICEKDMDCIPGRFGPGCQSECHCLGEVCDTRLGPPKCPWGCQPGWTGETCSKPKQKPEVRYFCINSPEKHFGSYVDVHVHTHGINFRSIYALSANSTKRGEWCPGTIVSSDDAEHEHVTIMIKMNETIADDIRDGKCSGQEVANNHFEWTLVIQEFEGILLESDIQVLISCDFNASETLQRSALSQQSDTQEFYDKVELIPETADVTLDVVDPYTREVITEATIGSHVALQIRFGYQEDSLVKGVRPHHCVATCTSGHESKDLLGHDGCTAPGSPVPHFQKDENSTNSISTPWFPLFAFADHTEVVFKCGFRLCFHADDCEPGCRHDGHHDDSHDHDGHHHDGHRHRRSAPGLWPELSTDQELDWTTKVIRILPNIPSQAKTTAKPPVTKKRSGNFQGRHRFFGKAARAQESKRGKTEQPALTPTTTTATTTSKTTSKLDMMALLSPITFGLLMLLVLMLTVVFLVFHFTLRRTVDDMRHEMLLQKRSRDTAPHYHNIPNLNTQGKVNV